jgi:hypothetical protein
MRTAHCALGMHVRRRMCIRWRLHRCMLMRVCVLCGACCVCRVSCFVFRDSCFVFHASCFRFRGVRERERERERERVRVSVVLIRHRICAHASFTRRDIAYDAPGIGVFRINIKACGIERSFIAHCASCMVLGAPCLVHIASHNMHGSYRITRRAWCIVHGTA